MKAGSLLVRVVSSGMIHIGSAHNDREPFERLEPRGGWARLQQQRARGSRCRLLGDRVRLSKTIELVR